MTTSKIGLIIGTLPARYRGIAAGGIATHIEGLIDSLHANGIKTYICYHKPFGIKHPEVINSLKIEWLGAVLKGLVMLLFVKGYVVRRYSFKTNVLIAYYYSTLSRFLKKNTPDFIHIHSLYNPATIALKWLKYSQKIIITDHGFWLDANYPVNKRLIFLLQDNYAIASRIVYISDIALVQHQRAKLGDLNKLVKISNPTFFSNYPHKLYSKIVNDKKIIIFNGYKESLTTKGLSFLLETVHNNVYLNTHVRLLIICNNEAKEYIQNHVWNFEYEMFGRTKFEDILKMYAQADLLVVPSKFESFGLVYTEALAVGIPVVGYYAMIDEFRETLNLYIGESIDITREQTNDLAQKIIKCLDSSFDQESVREALVKHYDWGNLINRFLILYYGTQSDK